ncbi:MAG: xylulokinase [Armatimonadetes bacterium]|nr:xylulokinase [Armatimonadota bacterium]
MARLLGIDIGTSGCKVVLIDEKGTLLKQAGAEYPLATPQPMWTEQNPEDWWAGVQKCLAEIGEKNPDAVGVTGQMHGSVFLDENDEVIRPALLWNDQRTVAECEEIESSIGHDELMRITCNPALTGFQLPKILWLRNHEPQNFARLRSVLLPKDYIRFKLTGVKATEVSDASGTGILDVPNRAWSEAMMHCLELDPSIFPKVYESDEVTGTTNEGESHGAGIPVVGGGGDQAAAAVGTGAVDVGTISVSLGTSGVVFTSIPGPSYDPRGAAHTFCHANRSWHAMGVMLSCGGALRWFRDVFCPGESYDAIAALAATAPVGSNGTTFLPYLAGERCPHNDPHAKGVLAGMTLATNKADISRAVFEGVTFGLLDGFELLKSLGAEAASINVTSGGSKSDFWVQMIADAFQAPCNRLEIDEGPAFGAAILAGVGIGVWGSTSEACKATVKIKDTVFPSERSYVSYHKKYRELYNQIALWNRN